MIEIIDQEPSTEDKIRMISEYYSKRSQWLKALEEVKELKEELEAASNPFGYEDLVFFRKNLWSECADVIIMIVQLAMQHGKIPELVKQIRYKVNRQLKRMKAAGWRPHKEMEEMICPQERKY